MRDNTYKPIREASSFLDTIFRPLFSHTEALMYLNLSYLATETVGVMAGLFTATCRTPNAMAVYIEAIALPY